MISFFVAGDPVGKARARVTRHGTYTPKKTVDAERGIAWAGKKALAGQPRIEGPVKLMVTARFPYPQSWPKKRRDAAFWHMTKPDWDNLGKIVSDALNGVLWKDDCQVASVTVNKHYTNSEAGLVINVEELYDDL